MENKNKMNKEYQIDEEYLIEDLDTLKVLADSRRLSILKSLGTTPLTVKQISKRVGMPATKLYYHINMMEQHNIIQVVDTRVVSGIIEKFYTVTAKAYKPGEGLLTAGDLETNTETLKTMVFSVMDNVRDELLRSFRAGIAQISDEVKPANRIDIASTVLTLTDEQTAEFDKALGQLLQQFCEKPEQEADTSRHSFFFVRFKLHEDDNEE